MHMLPKQLREANFLVQCVRGKPTPAVSLLTAMGETFKTIPSAEQERREVGSSPSPGLPMTLSFLQRNCSRHKSLSRAGKVAKLPGKETKGARWSSKKGKKLFTSALAITHFSIITNATHTHTHKQTIHVAGDQPTKLKLNAVAKARRGEKQEGSLGAELPLFYGEDARRIPLGDTREFLVRKARQGEAVPRQLKSQGFPFISLYKKKRMGCILSMVRQ